MNKKISIISPFYNESNNLSQLYESIKKIMNDNNKYEWELIFIDDGSIDNSSEYIKKIMRNDSRVKLISFIRNFGKDSALSAGYKFCSGNCAITIDSDMQQPPSIILDLIKKWEGGSEIVNAIRDDKLMSVSRKYSSFLFYRIFGLITGIDLKTNSSDFRLIGRKIIDLLNSSPEEKKFLRGLISWYGFKQEDVPYWPQVRLHGKTKINMYNRMKLAIDGITAFSTFPLRLISSIGVIICIFSIIYFIYIYGLTIIGGYSVPGYLSLNFIIIFIGGSQIFFIGILGEYLKVVLHEIKKRPNYIISESYGF